MHSFQLIGAGLLLIVWTDGLAAAETPAAASTAAADSAKVYGEWTIRVRPDKGSDYNVLIQEKGLPLFQAAGGRMVGWWTTLVGELYEHLTIWEYENLAAFEKGIDYLGKQPAFREFVAARDPLLSGEASRFLRLMPFSQGPKLPEPAKIMERVTHRVSLAQREAYLKYMQNEGIPLLLRHGFHLAGPWVVEIGDRDEITYLFRYDSLREREQLAQELSQHRDGIALHGALAASTRRIASRLLIPAPFANAHPAAKSGMAD